MNAPMTPLPGEGRAQVVRLEVVGQHVIERAEHQPPIDLLIFALEAPRQIGNRGRLLQQDGVEDLRGAVEELQELRIHLGVVRREPADALHRQLGAGAEEEMLAIQERHEHLRVFDIGVEAVFVQLQIADDLRAQQADDIGAGRHDEAGEWLFQRAGAADPVALLQHEHALARPRQIARRHQSIVARADDDRIPVIVLCRHCSEALFPVTVLVDGFTRRYVARVLAF